MTGAMRFLGLAVCLAMTVAGVCDEPKGKKEKKPAATATTRLLSKIELTDAQKVQVAAIDKEFAARFKELNQKRAAVLTDTQKKAQRDAQKKSRTEGATPAETRKSVDAALMLTPEQKEKMKEIQTMQTTLNASIVESLKKILTPEQQEKLPKVGQQKNQKKNRKKEPKQ